MFQIIYGLRGRPVIEGAMMMEASLSRRDLLRGGQKHRPRICPPGSR